MILRTPTSTRTDTRFPSTTLFRSLPPMLRRAQGREKARLRKKVKPPTRRPPEQVRPGRGSQPFPAFMAEHWSMSASMLIHFPKRRTGIFDMTRLDSFADLAEHYASLTSAAAFAGALGSEIPNSQLSLPDEPRSEKRRDGKECA